MTPLGKPPSKGPPACTASYVPPVLDTLFAGYQCVRTVLAVGASDAAYEGQPLSREADIGFGVALAILHAASASYGYSSVAECEVVHDEWFRRPLGDAKTHPSMCESDRDCPREYRCYSAGHERYCARGPVQRCKAEADCPAGYYCVSNHYCGLRPRRFACDTDGDCPTGYACVAIGTGRACQLPGRPPKGAPVPTNQATPGETPCTADSECPGDQLCVTAGGRQVCRKSQ